jgi:hypothetical protein
MVIGVVKHVAFYLGKTIKYKQSLNLELLDLLVRIDRCDYPFPTTYHCTLWNRGTVKHTSDISETVRCPKKGKRRRFDLETTNFQHREFLAFP